MKSTIPAFDSEKQPTLQTPPSTPDESVKLRRRFDEQTWLQLDGIDLKILDHINFLCKLQAKKSPTGAKYCCPSQKWLAKKLQVRRECINRHIQKLTALGVLMKTKRRKLRGVWQTNLYKMAKWMVWRLRAALEPIRQGFQPCAPKRTHSIPNGIESKPLRTKGAPTAVKGILTNLMEQIKRGEPLPET